MMGRGDAKDGGSAPGRAITHGGAAEGMAMAVEVLEQMGPGDLPTRSFGNVGKVVRGWFVLDRPSTDRESHIINELYEFENGRRLRLYPENLD